MSENRGNHRKDEAATHSPIPTPSDLKAIIEAERTGRAFVHWRGGDGQQCCCSARIASG